jgi:haloacetate dehalogenase
VFEGFESRRVETSEATIDVAIGGSGPPVLLLHGYPQTRAMWHAVAPALAERLTVVAADLRGYGDSSKPAGGGDHAAYSKRAMARDQVEAMAALGYDAFAVVGHDRGGRVGHRMALDHPERVTRLAVLDIVPTRTIFTNVSQEVATAYYHWFFLIQPYDFPERLIGADPNYYLDFSLASWSARDDAFSPDALAEYKRCFRDPATIHASCEDYRAAASIDLEHDAADLHRRVECPLLALWGSRGRIAKLFDVLGAWRERAATVDGRALDCGHFPAEEAPRETADELLAFLTA